MPIRATARVRAAALVLAIALALPGASRAQDRPSEDELFGGERPAERPPEQQPEKPARGEPGQPSEEEMFGGTRTPAAEATGAPPPVDLGRLAEHLQLGGQLYLRAQVLGEDGVAPGDWPLSSPNLIDVWADTRPNDRVRGFLLVRGSYDPTAGAGVPAGTVQTGAAASTTRDTTDVFLDQLWVNFDVGRHVFVTAGKQHVKWGVGRFWNPTDYLHPLPRDPLAVFDARAGVTMVKAHVPWEARGWNLYGVALLEDAAGEGRVDRLGRLGAGGRAEVVLGPAELGVDALVQRDNRPRFGVDLSAGIWDLDVYGEASLRTGSDRLRVRRAATPLGFEAYRPAGFTPGIVAGASWSHKYSDEDAFTLGAEYFFDDGGYRDASLYPVAIAAQAAQALPEAERAGLGVPAGSFFTPFYLGRQYAGAFLLLPSPGRFNDTSVTLSVLGNLSDRTAVARLDLSVLALTYLRVEAFVQGHAGRSGGEFRFAGELVVPVSAAGQVTAQSISVAAPTVDLGLALRVTL